LGGWSCLKYRTACAVPLLFTGRLAPCRFCSPDGLRRAASVYRTACAVPLLFTGRLAPCRFCLPDGFDVPLLHH
jgi:hypothetical protein